MPLRASAATWGVAAAVAGFVGIICAIAQRGLSYRRRRQTLYPPISPYARHVVPTRDGGHRLYVEESGSAQGKPALFVHGGPGAGSNAAARQLFDPALFRIVLVDQRGCGRSKPRGSTDNVTTAAFIDDLDTVRAHLGITRWHTVHGGSWGATLALAYTQAHPTRVSSLVLRGVSLWDPPILRWLYQQGASDFFPEAFAQYQAFIPEDERGDLLAAYHRRVWSSDSKTHQAAARSFMAWESALETRAAHPYMATEENASTGADLDFQLAVARMETHFAVHGAWLGSSDALLEGCAAMAHVPVVLVHGRFDMVCPPRSAWELHRRLPLSRLRFTCAGHSGDDSENMEAVIEAIGTFGAQELD